MFPYPWPTRLFRLYNVCGSSFETIDPRWRYLNSRVGDINREVTNKNIRNLSMISDSDILLIRLSCRLKIAAGTIGVLSTRGLASSANFGDTFKSASYLLSPFSTRRSFSRSLSRRRSRYRADGSPVVAADLDGVGLTLCGNPSEIEGCGVGGDLGEFSRLYRIGDPLSGDSSESTTS
jgi:hypothetical protein